MSNPLIESSKESFDPSKFSVGGITKPFILIFSSLSSGGTYLITKDRIIGIYVLVFAGVFLFFWCGVYIYLLLKDPNKLRSEKHEQRMAEIEKTNSVKSVSD